MAEIANPLHVERIVPIYKQALIFLIDNDTDRVNAYLEKKYRGHVPKNMVTSRVNAGAFKLVAVDDSDCVFVLWLKFWDGGTALQRGRLAHEAMHIAIGILHYVGYVPPLKPRNSEPICYLLDYIVRTCYEEIDKWQREEAKKRKHGRKVSARKSRRKGRSARRRNRRSAPGKR